MSKESKPELTPLEQLRLNRKKLAHRRRRIFFDNDGNEPVYYCKEATAEQLLAKRTTGVVGTQVDTISYCTWSSGFGMFTHDTKVGEVFTCTENKFSTNKTKDFIDRGTDPLRIMVDYCHQNGIEIFWSMRMNDTHDAWGAWYSPLMFPQLKKDHPEWLVSSQKNRAKHGGWSAVDFTHPEIRDLAFRFFEEVCKNYDVDGVEMDFLRHPLYFKSHAWGKDCSQEERDMMTDMVRRVRLMTEEVGLKRGRSLLVTVRVPDSVEHCAAMGIDIERWLREGLVDILVVSGYFRLNPWEVSVELGHKYGVPVYPCLSESRMKGEARKVRATLDCYRARAMNAWNAGADGIYMFNFFNPDSPLWSQVGDPEVMEEMDKVYVIGARGVSSIQRWMDGGEKRFLNRPSLSPERPVKLKAGVPFNVELRVGENVDKWKSGGTVPTVTLRLNVLKLDESADLDVKLNGAAIGSGTKKGDWIDYSVEPGLVKKGANVFTVALAAGSKAQPVLNDLLLWVRYGKE